VAFDLGAVLEGDDLVGLIGITKRSKGGEQNDKNSKNFI